MVESLMNRTALVNQQRVKKGLAPLTLKDMMQGHPSIAGGQSFYGPVRKGQLGPGMSRMQNDPKFAARQNKIIDQALGGSNVTEGHTDQGGPGDPNYAAGGGITFPNKERYGDWGFRGAKAFREEQQRQYRAAEAAQPAPGATAGGVGAAGEDRRLPNASRASEKGVDPRLAEIVTQGANALPPGYKVRLNSGARSASAPGFHPHGKATDWEIVAPDGTVVPNRGDDKSGLYTQLARGAYGYQEQAHPELTGKFQWGGQFGTSSKNPNEPDLMHFDIGGRRGRISSYSREKIGAISPDQIGASRRQALDKDMGNEITSRVHGTGEINVKVDAPSHFKVRARAGGLFKKHNIQRNTQMEPAQSAPPARSRGWWWWRRNPSRSKVSDVKDH